MKHGNVKRVRMEFKKKRVIDWRYINIKDVERNMYNYDIKSEYGIFWIVIQMILNCGK